MNTYIWLSHASVHIFMRLCILDTRRACNFQSATLALQNWRPSGLTREHAYEYGTGILQYFYLPVALKARLPQYYSPIKSQWHQGYTLLLQMLFPNKSTALQLHQTLGLMTWISWNRSHQLWNKKREGKIVICWLLYIFKQSQKECTKTTVCICFSRA